MLKHEAATYQKSAVNSSNIYKYIQRFNDTSSVELGGEREEGIMNRLFYPCSQRDTNSMDFWQ